MKHVTIHTVLSIQWRNQRFGGLNRTLHADCQGFPTNTNWKRWLHQVKENYPSRQCKICFRETNQSHWKELIAYFPLIWHRCLQQFVVATGTCLPGHLIVTKRRAHKLMEGISEVCRWDVLRFHDIRIKFHKDWFMHSKVDWGGGNLQTDFKLRKSTFYLFIFFSKWGRK
jgi:hypothetical protein